MVPLSSLGVVFVLLNIAVLLLARRRWAAIPLLVGACYLVLQQGIEIGPLNFFAIRILILAGIVRVVLRGEWRLVQKHGMDTLMILWSTWAVLSSAFHLDAKATLIGNLGLVFNAGGIYFLLRIFIRSYDDVIFLARATLVILTFVAAEMVYEQITVRNLFSTFGGVPEAPDIRNGRLRAQGPFAHAILAGTVGAVCVPFAVGLWKSHKRTALIGIVACLTMVFASASSGPILSVIFAFLVLILWRIRNLTPNVPWYAAGAYVFLSLIMTAPPYYLLARIDLTGGSTGWHRAELINAAITHLDEWWLAGTDFTRHWMPTGVSWSAEHTDITNHYIQLGVVGGLPLMLLFLWLLMRAVSYAYRAMLLERPKNSEQEYFIWCLLASLVAHMATCVSVSYFDQSFLFLYLTLAATATLYEVAIGDHGNNSGPAIVAEKRRLAQPRLQKHGRVRISRMGNDKLRLSTGEAY